MRVIDLTHCIRPDMPVYPGTEQPNLEHVCTLERDHFREMKISMFSHTGTHMDAPAHLLQDGITLDLMSPEQFLGNALVIDVRSVEPGSLITMEHLNPYIALYKQVDFLLFCTGWDRYWGTDRYFEGYPCMDEAVTKLVAEGAYKGIGVDLISVDPVIGEGLWRHKKLLGNGKVIIENLTNLGACGSEIFSFGCFPLKLQEADGAPVRAIAWTK